MLISNLQKLTLATPGSCTGSPPTPQPSTTGWGPACGWGTWSAVSANGPDGGSVGKTSSSSWTTLTESLMCLEVSMSPWYVLWDIFYASCCSPSSCPTVMQPMTQYPRCGKREMGLFGRILQSEGIQTLIHMLSLSPTGEIKSPARISWHQTVLPWGKGNVGKVKHFLSPSLIHPVSLFLSPCLFSWTLGLVQKFLSSVSNYWRQCSSGTPRPRLRGAGVSPWGTWVHSQDWGLCAYYLMHRWVRILAGSLMYGLVTELKPNGVEPSPQRHRAISRSIDGTTVGKSTT